MEVRLTRRTSPLYEEELLVKRTMATYKSAGNALFPVSFLFKPVSPSIILRRLGLPLHIVFVNRPCSQWPPTRFAP